MRRCGWLAHLPVTQKVPLPGSNPGRCRLYYMYIGGLSVPGLGELCPFLV